jgi:glycosyltransferase involved in cell wall biosynthesis
MTISNPQVSIGLPVFNGEKYLRESIDSILAQTFTDFELIISDNASTDATQDICQEYLTKDSRVKYHRNISNVGGHNNINITIKLSRGKYFRLAADDDVCAPELLAKYVSVLDRDPSVVLCYSTFMKIDENGQQIELIDTDMASSSQPHLRFQKLAHPKHNCETAYGLVVMNTLRKTDLFLNYSDADRTLLAELSLYGRYHHIPETLFFKRYHPGMSTEVYPDALERMAWFELPSEDKIQDYFGLTLTQLSYYLRIVSRAPLTFQERLRCYMYVMQTRFTPVVREGIRKIRRKLFLTRETFGSIKKLLSFSNKLE